MKSIAFLSLLLLGFSEASCPNSCSGHGTCGVDDICTCYPGWGVGGKGGGDCSDRFCPYELAWADGPTETGDSHKYAECANKGECDRATGECACFEGYEGKGCGRQSCPDQCSGHGTCEYVKDLKFGQSYHDYYDGSTYDKMGLGIGAKALVDTDLSWDNDRARTCVCDAGWTGLKCNLRMCPVGNDVMDHVPSPTLRQKHTITLYDSSTPMDNTNFGTQTFALQYTSQLNETFVTQPIAWNSNELTFADHIAGALTKLPNKLIDEVAVVVDLTNTPATITIEFTGDSVQGPQHKIEVLAEKCGKGCNPLIDGLANLRSWHATDLSTVAVTTTGSHLSFECGNRGKCEYSTGVCKCYTGFAGPSCNVFNAIA